MLQRKRKGTMQVARSPIDELASFTYAHHTASMLHSLPHILHACAYENQGGGLCVSEFA